MALQNRTNSRHPAQKHRDRRGYRGPTPTARILALNPALWLDGCRPAFSDAAGTTIAAVGDPVALWPDQSGQARNATQSAAAARPARTATGLNFDSVDDFLSTPLLMPDRVTILLIYQNAATGTLIGTANVLQRSAGVWPDANITYIPASIYAQRQATFCWDYIDDIYKIYGQGALLASETATARSNTAAAIDVGRGFNEFVGGEVQEVLIFARVLSDLERMTIEKILAAKHGIAR
jgi:hypothetical protein